MGSLINTTNNDACQDTLFQIISYIKVFLKILKAVLISLQEIGKKSFVERKVSRKSPVFLLFVCCCCCFLISFLLCSNWRDGRDAGVMEKFDFFFFF